MVQEDDTSCEDENRCMLNACFGWLRNYFFCNGGSLASMEVGLRVGGYFVQDNVHIDSR